MSEQQFKDYVERTSDAILALRVRNEVLEAGARHWNGVYKIILDERDALRARVAKLEAALEDCKQYAKDYNEGSIPHCVDVALEP